MKKFDAVIFGDATDPLVIYKPLGATKIAHVLRKHGYSCLVIDHLHTFSQTEYLSLLEKVVSDQTKFVGFSGIFLADTEGIEVMNPNAEKTFQPMRFNKSFFPQGKDFENVAVDKIRSINPECKIVLGGISQEIQNKNIDYSIAGYAEISALNLIRFLEGKESLQNCTKNIFGVTVINDKTALGYDFAESTMEWLPEDVFDVKVLPIEIARGCIFNCAFCSYPMRGKKTLDFVRKPEHIVAELQNNYDRYGITTYSLMDDTFNDNDEKLDLMLSAIKRLSFQPVFWCYSRLDLLSTKKDRLPKMFDIGVRAMYMGIETLDSKTGRLIGKGYDSGKQIDTINRIRNQYDNKILMHGSFIAGLPGESVSSIISTSDRILTGDIPLHTWRFQALKIWKNANLWQSDFEKNYKKYGYVDQDEDVNFSIRQPDHRPVINWKSDQMTFHECVELANDLNQQAHKSDRHHIPNQLAWALMNYSTNNFDKIAETKYNSLDWYAISCQKADYINEYKKKLNNFLLN